MLIQAFQQLELTIGAFHACYVRDRVAAFYRFDVMQGYFMSVLGIDQAGVNVRAQNLFYGCCHRGRCFPRTDYNESR